MLCAVTLHSGSTPVQMQMIAAGLLLLGAHLGGKLCQRLGFSDVTGHLVGGAIVGPYALYLAGFVPVDGGSYGGAVRTFQFFIFVFLSVIAFGIGEELYWARLRKVGGSAAVICLMQGGLTWLAISAAFMAASELPAVECLLLGSIGIATAPAVTFVIMNKLRVEGRLRHMVGSMVVQADLMGVLTFSVLMQVAMRESGAGVGGVLLPVFQDIGLALLTGGGIYLCLAALVRRSAARIEIGTIAEEGNFLHRLLAERPSPSAEILIVVFGVVALGTGIAYHYHLPFLITATSAGVLVAHFHSAAIFDSLKLENIAPVFNLVFFALVGAGISLAGLEADTAGLVVIYIGARFAGKLGGTWLGCAVTGEDRKIRACLPPLMLPQAGVAAVEAVYVSVVLGRPEVAAVILPAIVFFEVVGVVMVERALRKWASWVADEERVLRESARARTGLSLSAKRLLRHLSPERVALDLTGTGKNDVIEGLVDLARETSPEPIDRALALQVLGERERLTPTGMGEGVAIPHCRLIGLGSPVVVFGRHRTGVVFGGVDTSPCRLILLVLSSARKPEAHLALLSAAAHLLAQPRIRARLLAAESPEEFLDALAGTS